MAKHDDDVEVTAPDGQVLLVPAGIFAQMAGIEWRTSPGPMTHAVSGHIEIV